MTDDELRALWLSGATVRAIASIGRTTGGAIAGRIRRKRKVEGVARWPLRGGFEPRTKPAPAKRAGRSTLPPLSSLQ